MPNWAALQTISSLFKRAAFVSGDLIHSFTYCLLSISTKCWSKKIKKLSSAIPLWWLFKKKSVWKFCGMILLQSLGDYEHILVSSRARVAKSFLKREEKLLKLFLHSKRHFLKTRKFSLLRAVNQMPMVICCCIALTAPWIHACWLN